MDTKLAARLEVLADNTLSTVFERNRLKDLKWVDLNRSVTALADSFARLGIRQTQL